MNNWKKASVAVLKLSNQGKDKYFNKFPERLDWYGKSFKSHPYFAKRLSTPASPSASDISEMKEEVESEDKGEYDYEGDMAMSQLKSVITNAKRIHDLLKPDTNLPEWVQSKITLAEDYISTAANYLTTELQESTSVERKKHRLLAIMQRKSDQAKRQKYSKDQRMTRRKSISEALKRRTTRVVNKAVVTDVEMNSKNKKKKTRNTKGDAMAGTYEKSHTKA